jgi:hypothetical protein
MNKSVAKIMEHAENVFREHKTQLRSGSHSAFPLTDRWLMFVSEEVLVDGRDV